MSNLQNRRQDITNLNNSTLSSYEALEELRKILDEKRKLQGNALEAIKEVDKDIKILERKILLEQATVKKNNIQLRACEAEQEKWELEQDVEQELLELPEYKELFQASLEKYVPNIDQENMYFNDNPIWETTDRYLKEYGSTDEIQQFMKGERLFNKIRREIAVRNVSNNGLLRDPFDLKDFTYLTDNIAKSKDFLSQTGLDETLRE